jgi:hypothetical protein
VSSQAAVDDIRQSGVVRNAASAGIVAQSRWGNRVFWSRGKEDAYHIVPQGTYVIEAPFDIASTREVTAADIVAVHTKTEDGEVVNVWPQHT